METISFRFTLTVNDYLKTSRMNILTSHVTRGMFVGILTVCLGVIIILPGLRAISMLWMIPAAAIISLAYSYFIRPMRILRQVQSHARFLSETTWSVDGENITITTLMGESRTTWAAYEQIRETKDYFLLPVAGYLQTAYIIPKRAFESEEQAQAFREMAEGQIKERQKSAE
jgi:hypothetical protein